MLKRFCLISDTHNQHKKLDLNLEGVDFLIHTGDATSVGKENEVRKFNKWIGSLGIDKEHVIFTAGNHDFLMEKYCKSMIDEICTNFTYLDQQVYECDGVKFYGAPHTPYFGGWAFNVPRGEELARIWARIPDDTDVLLTHGPPISILDQNMHGEHCGCQDLFNRTKELNLKIHAFGHIHHSHGTKEIDGTLYVNASMLDDYYENSFQPIYIDMEI